MSNLWLQTSKYHLVLAIDSVAFENHKGDSRQYNKLYYTHLTFLTVVTLWLWELTLKYINPTFGGSEKLKKLVLPQVKFPNELLLPFIIPSSLLKMWQRQIKFNKFLVSFQKPVRFSVRMRPKLKRNEKALFLHFALQLSITVLFCFFHLFRILVKIMFDWSMCLIKVQITC